MKGNFREAQAYSMNQRRYIKSNLKSEKDEMMYGNWKNQMNEMYNDIHEQNNMEECVMQNMDVGDDGMEKKKKKGFFSKLGDKMSKNMQKQKRFNKNSLI
uniref:Uncharacterized protein n=1 Tax=Euplotes harpa TaxID=151035 RepID=A0A7S3N7T7_9SPIT|mmetsp:Transcript_1584/g.1924  ORF Transcript_1584/g.1924 Transcript_1584/m.1924 type:complete len:100 (+) Transcript_1584:305-604(+)